MKAHVSPCVERFQRIGFDLRTGERKAQDAKGEEAHKRWVILNLSEKYDRAKLYEEVWTEPMQKTCKEMRSI